MTKTLDNHMKLQNEVLAQPKTDRNNYIGRIEQFCTNLSGLYPQMSYLEKRHAGSCIRFWEVVYREITGTELNVPLISSRQA